MTPLRQSKMRKVAAREQARKLLISLISGERDLYEAYRGLYSLWCSNNAAVQELRPLFRMPGVEADGQLSITDEFRKEVVRISQTILQDFIR
jgi:hypothetical protein